MISKKMDTIMKAAFLFVLLISCVTQAQTSGKRTLKTSPKSAVPNDKEISKTILEFEETLRRAALAGDSTWWERHLDDNYIGVDPQGQISTKADAIQLHNSPDLKYDEINMSDMTLRTYNSDTVIIDGKSEIYGSYKGQNIGGEYHFVRVWVREGTDWKLAMSQTDKVVKSKS